MRSLAGLLFLVVLAAAHRIDNTKRCGVPEIRRDDSGSGRHATYKWPKKSLTYRILNHPPNSKMTPAEVEASVKWAFQTWSWYLNMTITKAENTDSDFSISFGPMEKIIGYAYFPPNGKVVFKDTENWYLSSKPGYLNFNWVVLHELGHAMGLEHTNDLASPMYPSYQWVDPMPTISDFQTMADMYEMKSHYKNCYNTMGG